MLNVMKNEVVYVSNFVPDAHGTHGSALDQSFRDLVATLAFSSTPEPHHYVADLYWATQWPSLHYPGALSSGWREAADHDR